MKFISTVIFLTIIFLIYSCDSTEPDELKQLRIALEDISAIEAWVHVKSFNIELPVEINFYLNSKLTKRVTLKDDDNVILLDSLLPNTNYSINASICDVSSDLMSAVTIDTTSHDYNWEFFTFGDNGSSSFEDVIILDENNILVVGELYLNDSIGVPDVRVNNLLYWNGIEWEKRRVSFTGSCSAVTYPPITSTIGFSIDDIWFSRQVA